MTNAILRGKPDAGNPHVRFDEGEVASAKPRRGSLLYKDKMKKFGAWLMAAALAFAGAGAAMAEDTTTYQALYWQVNAKDTTSFGDAGYAVLYASLDGGNVKIAGDGQLVNAGAVGQTQTVLQGTGAYDFTTANFFVELLNESGAFLAQSESVSYNSLLSGGYIATQGAGMPSPTTASPYAFSAYAVPEPRKRT